MSTNTPHSIIIKTTDRGGSSTYHARAKIYGCQASSTHSARVAAERCAIKCFHYPAKIKAESLQPSDFGITVENISPNTWRASWAHFQ